MFGLLSEDGDRGQEAARFMGNVILGEISAPTLCSLQSHEARFCGGESLINFIYVHPSVRVWQRPLSRSWCCRILRHECRLASLHRDLNAVNQTEAADWYFQAMQRFMGVLLHIQTAQISLNYTKVWISRGIRGILIICFWTGSSARQFERRGDLTSVRLHGEHLVKIRNLVSRAKCFLCISVNHKYALCLSYAFHHLLCTIRFRLHVLQIRR